MKIKFPFLLVLAIAIGTSTGVASGNIPAGICFGIGGTVLLMTLSSLYYDQESKN